MLASKRWRKRSTTSRRLRSASRWSAVHGRRVEERLRHRGAARGFGKSIITLMLVLSRCEEEADCAGGHLWLNPIVPTRCKSRLSTLRCASSHATGFSCSTARWAPESKISSSTRRAFAASALRDWPRDLRGNNDLLILTQPDVIREIHLAYFRAGADIVSTNTFSSTRIAQADYGLEEVVAELNRDRRTARPRSGRRRGARRWTPALCRRRNRADQSHRVDLARCRQSGLPRHHLRRIARGLWRAGGGAARRRRRHAARRDDLRYAQRQGGAVRDRRAARGARHARAGDDLGHDHRSLGPHAVRADAGGVLEFGPARRAPLDRPQLRARRQGDARAYRRAFAHRRYARLRLPECGPAERVRPLRREPGVHGRAARRVRAKRASSTWSAAAAARRRRISVRSPTRSRASRRAQSPR